MRLIIALVALVFPFSASADGRGTVKKKYPAAEEVSRYEDLDLDGLTMWHVTMPSVPDRTGARFIVGIDAKGRLVEGAELFKRLIPGVAPSYMARRAFDTLLGRAGAQALDPAADRRSSIGRPEEWALVAAPSVADGVLTFWFIQGEMHPEITRVQIVLSTGEVALRTADHVLHPPEAAIPKIRALLRDRSVARVKEGLQKVSEWKELAPDVEELLAHPDKDVRSTAVAVLGNLHLPRSVPAVMGMLERGPEWGDRSLAAQALLWRFGSPEAVAAVRARLARATELNEKYVLREMLADYDAGKRH